MKPLSENIAYRMTGSHGELRAALLAVEITPNSVSSTMSRVHGMKTQCKKSSQARTLTSGGLGGAADELHATSGDWNT
jgi:hypothetical protein